MLGALKLFGFGRKEPEPVPADFAPAIPEGERVYAIGDIHGRLDLLNDLLTMIDRDDEARGSSRTTLILLGDLVDRGPHSASVVERAIRLQAAGDRFHAIKGNHEEVMLGALAGDEAAMRLFLRIGGIQTLESYGVGLDDLPAGEEVETLIARMQAAIPREHADYLAAMADKVELGDYLFVHAGVRPGVPIDEQTPVEMRWIRDSFLDHPGYHGRMIVHGHSITTEPTLRPNRMGIDTGAYDSGVLTALGLEGTGHWLLQTEPTDADRAAHEAAGD
ncbi:serine/threonine protein phosphatase [Sphingomonas sp. AP4-R1]|uniref:metallophosphoesterase family protein n=1 Tax=Sphingomonas sp. AP4-R1 TaxID=2735134 RepID=UPI0014935969|nr:metallophosphoesterase family protein [Sphingomonas sp. AP4-R1]QJU57605.1 serine/threonine protein phosphatase [Sphingomonas sp. AP4-R1]